MYLKKTFSPYVFIWFNEKYTQNVNSFKIYNLIKLNFILQFKKVLKIIWIVDDNLFLFKAQIIYWLGFFLVSFVSYQN